MGAAFKIHDACALGEEKIRQEECLVEESATVVAQVENQTFHPLFQEFIGSLGHLEIRRARELAEPQIPGCVVHHEGCVQAVHGDFSTGDLERDGLSVAQYGQFDLRTGRTAHLANHAVLWEFHSCDRLLVYFQDAVTRLKSDFFGRASGDDFQHDGSVVGNIELYADSVEVTGEFCLGLFENCWRHVDGMRVEGAKSCGDGRIGNSLAVYRINVVFIQRLQHEIKFAPVAELGADQSLVLGGFLIR